MTNRRFLLSLSVLALTVLSCRFTASASTPAPDSADADSSAPAPDSADADSSASASYDWSALDAALESFVPTKVNGLTFLLAKDGQILYENALGNQTMDSFLPIASCSKMPSAAAILTLAQDDLLDLDEPIGTYLQGHISLPADKTAITTRMLLNHTSGLDGSPACLTNRKRETLQECAQEILNAPLNFAPGARFAYGGGGFQVAGYIAEVISGKSWNDLFQERFAAPLGLTTFTYSGGVLGNEINPRIAHGASSNVYDYNKILQMILNGGQASGGQVLSPQTIQMMKTNQTAGLPILRSPGEDEGMVGYSFGFWISDPSLHPGSVGPELNDQGAFGCTPWVDFDLGYSAVLLIKDNAETGREIWNAVRPIIIGQLAP